MVLRAPAEPAADLLDAYRPDSNFWYLTGFSEPDAVAVFRPGAPEGKRYTLFVKPKSWAEERWTGRRAGVEGAKEFRADAAYPIADFQKESRPLLAGAKALYYVDARDKEFREKLVSTWQALAAARPRAAPRARPRAAPRADAPREGRDGDRDPARSGRGFRSRPTAPRWRARAPA